MADQPIDPQENKPENSRETEWDIEPTDINAPPLDTVENKKEALNNLSGLIQNLRHLFVDTLDIKDGTDVEGNIAGIKRDIDFKGVNVWILIFSIFIASIGLNTNSTAVVIGAMLISPLMGPILGVGLAIGINDWATLLRSLKSLGIAVSISIATSCIYFLITPLGDASNELLARTRPTTLDIFVALFGGFAGAIAGSRKEKTNVVPGVAIATALMPPLCTAGYGLATLQLQYFLGAFYLFLLNSVFISLATYITVRYLRYPLKEFMDKVREKRVRRWIFISIVIVVIPSTGILLSVVKESLFQTRAQQFVNTAIQFEGSSVARQSFVYEPNIIMDMFRENIPEIEVLIIGTPISERDHKYLEGRLSEFKLAENFLFKDTKLIVRQNKEGLTNTDQLATEVRAGILEDIYKKNEEDIRNKDERIDFLEQQLVELRKNDIPYNSIFTELQINYENLARMGFAQLVEKDTANNLDTIPVFMVRWNDPEVLKDEEIVARNKKMQRWLQVRLEMDTVAILPY